MSAIVERKRGNIPRGGGVHPPSPERAARVPCRSLDVVQGLTEALKSPGVLHTSPVTTKCGAHRCLRVQACLAAAHAPGQRGTRSRDRMHGLPAALLAAAGRVAVLARPPPSAERHPMPRRLAVLGMLEQHAVELCGDAPEQLVRALYEAVRDRSAAPSDGPEGAARLQLAALQTLTSLCVKLGEPGSGQLWAPAAENHAGGAYNRLRAADRSQPVRGSLYRPRAAPRHSCQVVPCHCPPSCSADMPQRDARLTKVHVEHLFRIVERSGPHAAAPPSPELCRCAAACLRYVCECVVAVGRGRGTRAGSRLWVWAARLRMHSADVGSRGAVREPSACCVPRAQPSLAAHPTPPFLVASSFASPAPAVPFTPPRVCRRMEEAAPTLLLAGSRQLLDLARAEATGAAEAYVTLAASVLSHGAGARAGCKRGRPPGAACARMLAGAGRRSTLARQQAPAARRWRLASCRASAFTPAALPCPRHLLLQRAAWTARGPAREAARRATLPARRTAAATRCRRRCARCPTSTRARWR